MLVFIAGQDSHKLVIFNGMPKVAPKGKRKFIARDKKSKLRVQLSRGLFIQKIKLPKDPFGGFPMKPISGEFIFTMQCVATEGRGGFWGPL